MRTPIKWAGSKHDLADALAKFWAAGKFTRWVEPFFGGGSVFFHLLPRRALLGDACIPLMYFWRVLRKRPAEVAKALARHARQDSAAYYYQAREVYNTAGPQLTAESAANFLYLNRACFQGLWRVNASGAMNVGYGRPEISKRVWPSAASLHLISEQLKKAALHTGDFASVLQDARAGDCVYCDPPYVGTFDGHTKERFDLADHIRLTNEVEDAVRRGAAVVVSNCDSPMTREFYRGWEHVPVPCVQKIAKHHATYKPEAMWVKVP